eukprot:COSAG04_NODE_3707_length_2593_cov_1.339615_2_plen_86_part_00
MLGAAARIVVVGAHRDVERCRVEAARRGCDTMVDATVDRRAVVLKAHEDAELPRRGVIVGLALHTRFCGRRLSESHDPMGRLPPQ